MPRSLLRQGATLAIGLLIAGAMVWLGFWQLDVYRAQGTATASRRAAEPPVQLTVVAPAGQPVGDAFGRTVSATGQYDPALQVLLPIDGSPGWSRVLTGLRQADGSVVAVIRGRTSATSAPPPPDGTLTQLGVFLPSEDDTASSGDPTTAVRLPLLAQQWRGPLVGGFVTLNADDAVTQGLDPVTVHLPDTPGRLRNGAYALQWWLFAIFAIAMAIRIAREQRIVVPSEAT